MPQGDFAENRARSGLQHESTARSTLDGRAHVGDRLQAELDQVLTMLRFGALGPGHRLAGEDRLVALELARLQKP